MRVEDFQRIRETDVARLGLQGADWLFRWDWAQEYHRYNGPQDLIRWFRWMKPYAHYLPVEQVQPLAELSEKKNREILRAIDANCEYMFQYVDEYSATDYLFQNSYPLPRRMQVRRVLDFGPGYGRQINLWSRLHPDLVYVGMDAIELPYCLQHYYYRQFDLPLREYVESANEFVIGSSPAVYHLPTWRDDLLPDGFFDLVICVQVLPEISEQLVRHMLRVFHRCIKPGGALYIRDHERAAMYAHTLDLDRILVAEGFVLEFRPYVSDSWYSMYKGHGFVPDVHGIPRVWRKQDPTYPPNCPPKAETRKSLWQTARERIAQIDWGLLGTRAHKGYRTFKRRRS